MSRLKIYKASAGSGKTYTLAKDYLKLLFDDPYNYKYILAVTFTNKATAEMKNRILNYLYSLTIEEDSEFLDELIRQTKKDEKYVRNLAKRILTYLLNDFSHFNITTIDSFFQKIIRSFAFEAGLPVNLKVEIDYENVLKEAIDTLLKELDVTGKEELKRWIFNQTFNKLKEKGEWRINYELFSLGKEIFKEDFQKLSPGMIEKINDKSFLESYEKSLKDIVSEFERSFLPECKKGLQALEKHNLSLDDLKSKNSSPLSVFSKVASGNDLAKAITGITKLEKISSAEDLYTKTSKKKDIITGCYESELKQIIDSLIQKYNSGKERYFTAKAILPHIPSYGILSDISQTVKRVAQEKNIFLLSNANQLLNRIIDGNDTPFIYEKTGTRYKHYMIDEFQDTSDLQWLNFKPLIGNSLSENNTSLVVGDVKQSIYRWRNSDWKLLSHGIQTDYINPGVEQETLQTNWRSHERIISFNNFIFEQSAKLLQSAFIQSVARDNPSLSLDDSLSSMITTAYHDVFQKVSKNGLEKGGYVEINFPETANKDEYQEAAMPLLCEKIDELTGAGYSFRDICILVRTREEGQIITEYLLGSTDKAYPVISDETLVLESSAAVTAVISKLKIIQEPDNEILKAAIKLNELLLTNKELFGQDSLSADTLSQATNDDIELQLRSLSGLKGKPLFEMVEILVRSLPVWMQEEQSPYLRELLNKVQDFINNRSVNLADFIEWWEDKGRLTSISIPDGQDAIKIMTIHKSKGLEFKAVIIPFCHWKLDRRRYDSLIWCKPQTEPFNRLEFVPVSYTSKLIQSELFHQYINERLLQYIDNLNLLYVAFTRSREVLVTIGSYMKPSKKEEQVTPKTVADLLFYTLDTTEGSDNKEFKSCWDKEEKVFKYGEIPIQTEQKRETVPAQQGTFRTNPLGSRIKIHTDSNSMQHDLLEQYRVHGKIMHLLFEKIKTVKDIGPAIDSLIFEGKLTTDIKQELKNKIETLLFQDPIKRWFSNEYTILNEATILQKEGAARPDRVLIGSDEVIVIDYKFGKVKSRKYHKQVSHYIELIREMGYKNVKGYLWYINNENMLEEV